MALLALLPWQWCMNPTTTLKMDLILSNQKQRQQIIWFDYSARVASPAFPLKLGTIQSLSKNNSKTIHCSLFFFLVLPGEGLDQDTKLVLGRTV